MDYYQNNTNFSLSSQSVLNSSFIEAVFNLWGVPIGKNPNGQPTEITIADPATTASESVDISSMRVGHGEVPQWFLTNLAALTEGDPPPNPLPPWSAPASSGGPPSQPSGSASPGGGFSSAAAVSASADQLVVFPAALDEASGAATSVYVLAATSSGNLDPSFNGTVRLAVQNGNGAQVGSGLAENAVDGVAEFSNVGISTPGNGYVLCARSVRANSGNSPPLDISGDQLAITTGPPSTVSVGSSYPIVVVAENGSGKVDSGFNGKVTVTLGAPSGGSQLVTLILNAVNGKASGKITFVKSGQFLLVATSNGVAEASCPIAVTTLPVVTGVSPATGLFAGGTTVTITGTNFTDVTQVNFGQAPATSFTVNSPTQITATSPPEAAGTVDVTVTTAEGISATSSADRFTYTEAATSTLLTSSLDPSANGQQVVFTATVSATLPAAGTPSGSVTFKDGSTLLGTVALETVNSVATATWTTSTLKVGGHAITASFAGSADFLSSSGTLTQTVKPYASNVSLASSAASTVFGQMVTFTATVKSSASQSPPPTGTVTFKDGGAALGVAVLETVNGTTTATFATQTLPVGADSIAAVYGGDTNFTGGTSGTVTETVAKAGTVTGVVSSANPSTSGRTVTFTATVQVSTPGSGPPTGIVTFLDGTKTLGTGKLITAAGVTTATFSTMGLAVGSHNITASYAGNGSFNGSVSTALTQVITSPTSATLAFQPLNDGSLVTPSLSDSFQSSASAGANSAAPWVNDVALVSLMEASNGDDWTEPLT